MKLYRKTELTPMEPWTPDTDMTGVSISDADRVAGCPRAGDMIATSPKNPNDRWLIEASTHARTYEAVEGGAFGAAVDARRADVAERHVDERKLWDREAALTAANAVVGACADHGQRPSIDYILDAIAAALPPADAPGLTLTDTERAKALAFMEGYEMDCAAEVAEIGMRVPTWWIKLHAYLEATK